MTKPTVRIGDSVLVRCKVVPMTEGSTRDCYPGIEVATGGVRFSPDNVDIVTVEQAFRVGDRVRYDYQRDKVGEIVALSPDGVSPRQAWVKDTTSYSLITRNLDGMQRLDQ